MLIIENILMAFASLWSNKMRAFLTMLGIIIGIGSVIAIMTVSSSLTASISDSFQEMGANNITVGLQQSSDEETVKANGMRFGVMAGNVSVDEEDRITDGMIDGLVNKYQDEIDAIAISESVGSGTAKSGKLTAKVSVTGINADYFKSSKITLLAGRKIREADVDGRKKVIMVSDRVVSRLFDGDNDSALAQAVTVSLGGTYSKYYIVGVYKYEFNSELSGESDSNITTEAYIPLSTGKQETRSDDGYGMFTIVTSTSVKSVSDFADDVEAYFVPYYAANKDYEIATATMESMIDSMTDMINTESVAIAFIAGISLLVGGIGVMNIMLVSVTERTKEIGTRKALGARNSSIRIQFIVESVVLCLVGGMLGIITGLILGALAAGMLGYSASAPVAAIITAVGFSMVIGIFFGYYPANKAAKLNPIDALRYE